MNDDDEYVMSRRSYRQLMKFVAYVKGRLGGDVPRGKYACHVPYQRIGITTTAIRGRSGKTPGSGSVQAYYDNGTELVEDTTLGVVEIKNWSGSGVGTGIWVKFTIIDGFLYLDGSDCSGVAA